MADIPRTTENIEAYKQGVSTTAPAAGWSYSKAQRPEGKNDVEFVGVELDSHDGLTTSEQRMRLPKGDMSLKQIFSELANVPENALKREVPGTTAQYYHEIGQHEGGHLHQHHGYMDGGLKDEISADYAAMNGDNPEVEEALRDARKISALTNPSHATSIGLPEQTGDTPPEISTIKLHAAANEFHDTVAADLMAKGHIQKMEDLKDLQKKNPEIVVDSVKELKGGGAFDQIEGSKGRYVRQMADDYIDTTEKWIKTTPSAALDASSSPRITAPQTGGMAP